MKIRSSNTRVSRAPIILVLFAASPLLFNGSVAAGPSNRSSGSCSRIVDDMESIKNVTSIDLSQRSWDPASLPLLKQHLHAARTHWCNPLSRMREGDLHPQLPGSEANAVRRPLELRFERDRYDLSGLYLWGGVQQCIDKTPLDVIHVQDLEIWVNEHPESQLAGESGRQAWPANAVLHVDLGLVSEDAQWDPNALPNGRLDTENAQGPSAWRADRDDVGLDGVPDSLEVGLDYDADPADRNGDDFHDVAGRFQDENRDSSYWLKYMGVNGTEKNRRFDTEDLDGNGQLDTVNLYSSYSTLLATLEQDAAVVGHGAPGTGWKRLRMGFFSLSPNRSWEVDRCHVKYVRVWVEGALSGNRLSIGEISLVNYSWGRTGMIEMEPWYDPIRVTSVSNKEDADYTPPPGVDVGAVPGNGGLARREQSMSVDFVDLVPRSSLSVGRAFPFPDAPLYPGLNFHVRGSHLSGPAPRIAIRLRDVFFETWYEYSTPVPRDAWEWKHADFNRLLNRATGLPINAPASVVIGSGEDTLRFFSYRRPMTAVGEIEVILRHSSLDPDTPSAGSVWVDDIQMDAPGARSECGTFLLRQISPNPARGKVDIHFDLGVGGPTFLAIFNAEGRRVRDLGRVFGSAGLNTRSWDGLDDRGSPASSGIYFCRLDVDGRFSTARLVWLK